MVFMTRTAARPLVTFESFRLAVNGTTKILLVAITILSIASVVLSVNDCYTTLINDYNVYHPVSMYKDDLGWN
ncbi:hypothetical protein DASC09_033950 [Saccharomycopsis crataegensis]|uniref:Nematode cuticle collagen N-terminal domain-containing protein n=1 Tax=Saccharomycopsis crataegensis TaxID=43959 RepID=A0AAV5QM78_9ASCO|nr:hypothetical protein DASC09_033950 [Saccharomycopsis crataegensis]